MMKVKEFIVEAPSSNIDVPSLVSTTTTTTKTYSEYTDFSVTSLSPTPEIAFNVADQRYRVDRMMKKKRSTPSRQACTEECSREKGEGIARINREELNCRTQ